MKKKHKYNNKNSKNNLQKFKIRYKVVDLKRIGKNNSIYALTYIRKSLGDDIISMSSSSATKSLKKLN